jgi:hypothetical protein
LRHNLSNGSLINAGLPTEVTSAVSYLWTYINRAVIEGFRNCLRSQMDDGAIIAALFFQERGSEAKDLIKINSPLDNRHSSYIYIYINRLDFEIQSY